MADVTNNTAIMTVPAPSGKEGAGKHVLQRYFIYRFYHLLLYGLFIFSYGLLVLLLVSALR